MVCIWSSPHILISSCLWSPGAHCPLTFPMIIASFARSFSSCMPPSSSCEANIARWDDYGVSNKSRLPTESRKVPFGTPSWPDRSLPHHTTPLIIMGETPSLSSTMKSSPVLVPLRSIPRRNHVPLISQFLPTQICSLLRDLGWSCCSRRLARGWMKAIMYGMYSLSPMER